MFVQYTNHRPHFKITDALAIYHHCNHFSYQGIVRDPFLHSTEQNPTGKTHLVLSIILD